MLSIFKQVLIVLGIVPYRLVPSQCVVDVCVVSLSICRPFL